MLEPIYPEYIPLEDEHILSVKEQPLPPVVLPTAESPGYVTKLDLKEDPEEYVDDETEDGPVDYPMDGGDDDDAPADFAVVIPAEELVSPPKGTEHVIPPPSTDTTTTGARISVRLQAAISFPPEAKVERLIAMPTSSPTTSLSPPSAREHLARCMAPVTLLSPPLPPPLHMPPPVDQIVPEIAPMTVEEVNTRVLELAELHEHDTKDLYALLEDAQDSRTRMSQRVAVDSQWMAETLRVMGDMRQEMGDIKAELLALRKQPRRVGQLGGDARVPNHQDAPRDVDTVMSSSDSTVTYTSVSSEDVPFWGIRFFGMEQPNSPEPHDLDYVPGPMYPEYISLEDEHILSTKEQPLPPVVSPTTESPKYVAESDPEEDPEEYEDEETEDGLVDYPMDGGDDGDDDDIDSSGDEADDEEEDEEKEEEEHLAPTDSAIVIPTDELALIDAVTSAIASPLLPPLYIQPPVDCKDDVLEIEMPPHKRLCLSTLGSRYEAVHSELQTHQEQVYAYEFQLQAHQIQLQLQETLRVIGDMRREMGDMQAELLALREQPRRARQPGGDARVPDHQDAPKDADSHI
nr:hypothetical protein [Tanacetum cinerariifolium]